MSSNENIGGSPLIYYIRQLIQNSPNQSISFYHFMNESLYHPEYGYYSRESEKLGKQGDFYTSSSIGTIMGEMVAGYIVRLQGERNWSENPLSITEWGGGTGRLAKQILDTIQLQNPQIYSQISYMMIEKSAIHRAMQRELLQEHAAKISHYSSEGWLEQAQWHDMVVLSNELLDAFPVHRIKKQNGTIMEIYVAWNEQAGQFQEVLQEMKHPEIMAYLQDNDIHLLEQQIAEVNIDAGIWMEKVGNAIQNGHIITIDYGHDADELYREHRMLGTLMCYKQHKAHDNPYIHIGEQDMTTHVNFSDCIRAGVKAGFHTWTLRTQKDFLIDAGILHELRDHQAADPFSPTAKRNRAIRQLLISDQMSELFKVLTLSK